MGMPPSSSRVQAIHEIGIKIDDALEKAQLDAAKKEGIHEAYTNVATSLVALLNQVDKEHAGRDADVARSWVNRIITIMQAAAGSAKAQMHSARGAEKQTREMVQLLKEMYDAESRNPVLSSPPPVVAAPPAPPPPPPPAPIPPPAPPPVVAPKSEPPPPPPPPPSPPPPSPAEPPAKPVDKKELPERKGRPKKGSKQLAPVIPPPPPLPAPLPRTRPISIKERRNKGME